MSNVTFMGDGNPIDELETVLQQLRSPSAGLLEPFGDAIRQGIGQNFANESDGDGTPWTKLSPATVRDRARHGYPGEHPILQRSGDLLDTLLDPSSGRHIQEFSVSGAGWDFSEGSSDRRVEWQDSGTDNGAIPARPFLDVPDSLLDQAADLFFDLLMGR